ncbi:related to GGA2 - Arf-binding protein [Melanopsichium pennsylvanicum]|uniref:Related to GGA2 - Arf-binding protein n=2 Tax=Melanopsichium pennsylvanicum TaxID=63383 RepID=A0AAJ5C3A8_9BASI|nr:related to GGA2-Arf-binding protein [Melanopsichium pennsylvanicum 4]SNX82382.1 related to GGA2 - Arf-binding protein [Melanopsichium pennsylvanicum]
MYNHHSQGRYPGGSSRPSSNNLDTAPQGALGALADWAARNLDPELQTSPVSVYVERCCHPALSSPNLALNLELADYVNQKKANTPREAAFETVRKINSRNPHVGMLGLALLDILVKNCGYPLHLQVATKEFLNEMVKRFPERPPVFPSPVQSKILELIHEWKLTLCVTSKHREDLVHIRDMHRLLTYKGYRFPNVDSRAASVMNSDNNLKSPEELEEEDRAAQGAKLQELIRRGTPKDLAQAQELMKIMSGAEPESKPDYTKQTRRELDKVQSRAILLNDMLNNAHQGEKFAQGDAYDQIASHLRSVQPRIQKWIGEVEEGEEGGDNMDRLLLVNDLINQVVERYKQFTKGNFGAQVIIDPSIDPNKGGADAVPTAKISDLISFDDEQPSADQDKGKSGSIMDDFASLTFDDASTKTGVASSSSVTPAAVPSGFGGLPVDLFSNESGSSTPKSGTATSNPASGLGNWGALQLPTTATSTSTSPRIPQTGTQSTGNRNLFDLPSLTPSSNGQQQNQQQSHAQSQTQKPTSNDPFADLDSMFK